MRCGKIAAVLKQRTACCYQTPSCLSSDQLLCRLRLHIWAFGWVPLGAHCAFVWLEFVYYTPKAIVWTCFIRAGSLQALELLPTKPADHFDLVRDLEQVLPQEVQEQRLSNLIQSLLVAVCLRKFPFSCLMPWVSVSSYLLRSMGSASDDHLPMISCHLIVCLQIYRQHVCSAGLSYKESDDLSSS